MANEEKCTFDIGLTYYYNGSSVILDNVVIGEIKRKTITGESPILKTFRNARIYPARFSKYCFGMVALYPGIKYNSFKRTINTIKKIA